MLPNWKVTGGAAVGGRKTNVDWEGTVAAGTPNPVLGVCCCIPKPLVMLVAVGATAGAAAGLRGLRAPKAGVGVAPMPNAGCCAATCGSGGLFARVPKDGRGVDAPLAGWGKAGDTGWEPNENVAALASLFWPKTNWELGKAGLAGSMVGAAAGREMAACAVVAGARKPASCPAVVVWLPPGCTTDGCCTAAGGADISLGFAAKPNENCFGAVSAAPAVVAGVPKLKGLVGVSTVAPNFGVGSTVAPN